MRVYKQKCFSTSDLVPVSKVFNNQFFKDLNNSSNFIRFKSKFVFDFSFLTMLENMLPSDHAKRSIRAVRLTSKVFRTYNASMTQFDVCQIR